MKIESHLTTLGQIVAANQRFTVPIYQRLYVWGPEQIGTLLADLWTAFSEGKPIFYLGGALVMEREGDDGRLYELIDGQQRFTTLWMMSLAWGRALAPFRSGSLGGVTCPRVSFGIRGDVDEYFAKSVAEPAAQHTGPGQLVDALATIRAFLTTDKKRRTQADEFTAFIYEKVQLVLTRVPSQTDLNKLFEVINSRGQQLQHHEILKARMLADIAPAERQLYAQLWEACSDMGSYVEKSLKSVSRIKLQHLISDEDSDAAADKLGNADIVIAELAKLQQAVTSQPPIELAAILQEGPDEQRSITELPGDEKTEADEVRSILSFPMLLQHALRLWLHETGRQDLPRISDKELLRLFQDHFFSDRDAQAAKRFIRLLWEVRYVLDKFVIKWVSVGDEEWHQIGKLCRRLEKSTWRLTREQPTTSDAFTLLQSMLYHSQQITTHYWLTPLLAYMRRFPASQDDYLLYLRHLDNDLLCTSDDRPQIERSRDFLADKPGDWHRSTLDSGILDEPRGVEFPHYWFYKLEFLLWDRRPEGIGTIDAGRLAQFRITARNSVEHISPQSPQQVGPPPVSASVRDTFGNLALVSRSVNSEYGNLPFNEKRERFQNRNAARIDSLKLWLIYREKVWDDETALAHQAAMISLIRDYLAKDFSGSSHA